MHSNFNDLKTKTMNTEKAKKHFNNAYALCPWHVSPHVQEWLIKQMEEYHQTQLKLLGIGGVRLPFDELKDKILKHKAKSEYKQASIVILRNIFEENEA